MRIIDLLCLERARLYLPETKLKFIHKIQLLATQLSIAQNTVELQIRILKKQIIQKIGIIYPRATSIEVQNFLYHLFLDTSMAIFFCAIL